MVVVTAASGASNFDMDTDEVQQAVGSGERDNEEAQGMLGEMPDVCLAKILSFLSPLDVVKFACLCRAFYRAASFDSVWESMMPSNYQDILAHDADIVPGKFESKKKVFDHLCNPVIVANHTQAFWLDRETGGVCMSVGARGLFIVWIEDHRYWDWVPDQNSMFREVAQLKNVCWFEAKGRIECRLPPGAYTFSWRAYLSRLDGWDSEPAHFTFTKNDTEDRSECMCYIDPSPGVYRQRMEEYSLPTIRGVENGWTEYDVGEFVVEKGEENCVLSFSMLAIHMGAWKSGLFLDGVVVRPTRTIRQTQSIASPVAEPGYHIPEYQPEGREHHFPEVLRRFFRTMPNFNRSWTR